MADQLTIADSQPLPQAGRLSIVKSEPLEQPSALSRLGSAFWEGSGGKAMMDLLGGASRNPELAKKSLDTAKSFVDSLKNEPARVWSELSQTGQAMTHGDVSGTASHLGGAVPFVGSGALQVQHDFENKDYASGFGHAMALLLPFAAKGTGAASRLAESAGAAVDAVPAMAGRAMEVATSPAAKDVLGIVSPRAAHGLSLLTRVRNAVASLNGNAEATPAPAAIPSAASVTPNVGAPEGYGVNAPLRPPMRSASTPSGESAALPPAPHAGTEKPATAPNRPATPLTTAPQVTVVPSGSAARDAATAASREASARAMKVTQLANVLHEHGISAADAKLMEAQHWAQVAQAIGLRSPSEISIGQVIGNLQRMEQAGASSAAVVKKPQAAAIAQQLADEMRRSGTIE